MSCADGKKGIRPLYSFRGGFVLLRLGGRVSGLSMCCIRMGVVYRSDGLPFVHIFVIGSGVELGEGR